MSSVKDTISRIESFMKAVGGSSRDWRVGLARDGQQRLASLNKAGPSAEVWDLGNEKMAIAVIAYFLQSGCQLDGNESGATQLYAYKSSDRPLSFREFLMERAKSENTAEKANLRTEWVDSLTRLTSMMREWLRASDPGVLQIEEVRFTISEQDLGEYEAPGLRIRLGDTVVSVRPVARNVVGVIGPRGDLGVRPQGRVDISNGIQKFVLYRMKEGDEVWVTFDDTYRQSLFDQTTFESILEELLS